MMNETMLREAYFLVDEIEMKAEEIIEELSGPGAEFAESVRDKALSMKDWMDKEGRVTDRMHDALQNMNNGLDGWLDRI